MKGFIVKKIAILLFITSSVIFAQNTYVPDDKFEQALIIYNMLGQKVKTFNMQSTPAGYHSLTWNATNDLGQQVGAGVYLYQLQAKDFVKTRKMVLLK